MLNKHPGIKMQRKLKEALKVRQMNVVKLLGLHLDSQGTRMITCTHKQKKEDSCNILLPCCLSCCFHEKKKRKLFPLPFTCFQKVTQGYFCHFKEQKNIFKKDRESGVIPWRTKYPSVHGELAN